MDALLTPTQHCLPTRLYSQLPHAAQDASENATIHRHAHQKRSACSCKGHEYEELESV
ncbi:uncharacterized protein EDB91DRAFT_1162067 [Suillus paluster]|uniref:uncharacterized protein n=1 Tax=Suillus paluster TaxID=48578 RepID=UPI001B882637|nr:uncharacterized protein EDB91DRAFT_1162067 [Suillus paluster]KAG1728374.1 hypothetical protein EDB91DRAFT_1162067 [Suillus paluster]